MCMWRRLCFMVHTGMRESEGDLAVVLSSTSAQLPLWGQNSEPVSFGDSPLSTPSCYWNAGIRNLMLCQGSHGSRDPDSGLQDHIASVLHTEPPLQFSPWHLLGGWAGGGVAVLSVCAWVFPFLVNNMKGVDEGTDDWPLSYPKGLMYTGKLSKSSSLRAPACPQKAHSD